MNDTTFPSIITKQRSIYFKLICNTLTPSCIWNSLSHCDGETRTYICHTAGPYREHKWCTESWTSLIPSMYLGPSRYAVRKAAASRRQTFAYRSLFIADIFRSKHIGTEVRSLYRAHPLSRWTAACMVPAWIFEFELSSCIEMVMARVRFLLCLLSSAVSTTMASHLLGHTGYSVT